MSSRKKFGPKRCFVSAGGNVDLSPLRDTLKDMGIAIVTPQLRKGAVAAFEDISVAIRSADMVIGVLTTTEGDANVLFELGFAHALGKPGLIVAPEQHRIPSDLFGSLFVPNGLDNPEGLRFNLEQMILGGAKTESRAGEMTSERSESIRTSELLSGSHDYGSALEKRVAEILRKGGAEIVSTSAHKTRSADLAVWLDQIVSLTGGPLLVEVKSTLDHPGDASAQMEQFLARSGTRLGLIVYEHGGDSELVNRRYGTPEIYFYRLLDLARDVAATSAAAVVRRLRNRMVHGA